MESLTSGFSIRCMVSLSGNLYRSGTAAITSSPEPFCLQDFLKFDSFPFSMLVIAWLATSCFPGIWFDRTTVGEFTIACDLEDDMVKAFQDRLQPYFEDDNDQQIVFALQEHEWTIPIVDGGWMMMALVDFIAELDLFIGEFIAVLMTKELLARVIVFDSEGGEKMYSWY
ncbi:hypothetical protein RHSIM_Rhsim12G0007500 [Rhododendron simsii]|uniref:Uncharacterized protein n=1 Tax=Rhododendron simsii TaxID=118357 RepID=A0A834G4N3_RHOSS|nr:hypothetical protein RHSIM_Rhsim12G0007500 [Rhododendron simsii]